MLKTQRHKHGIVKIQLKHQKKVFSNELFHTIIMRRAVLENGNTRPCLSDLEPYTAYRWEYNQKPEILLVFYCWLTLFSEKV